MRVYILSSELLKDCEIPRGASLIARPGYTPQGEEIDLSLQESLEKTLSQAIPEVKRLSKGTQDLKAIRLLRDTLETFLREADRELRTKGRDVLVYISPTLHPTSEDIIASLLYQLKLPENEVRLITSSSLEAYLQSIDETFLEGEVIFKKIDWILVEEDRFKEAISEGFTVTAIPPESLGNLKGKYNVKVVQLENSWVYAIPEKLRDIASLLKLLNTMARVRLNCPWDIKQSSETIRSHLIEEAYEALEAISRGELDKFKEELGDVLLQVVFHSRIQEDLGNFDFSQVVEALAEKLRTRHPHVFGYTGTERKVHDVRDVLINWETSKRRESKGVFSNIPKSAPPTLRFFLFFRKLWRLGVSFKDFKSALDELEKELRGEEAERLRKLRKAIQVISNALEEGIPHVDLAIALILLSLEDKANLHDLLSDSVSSYIEITEKLLKAENWRELDKDKLKELLRAILAHQLSIKGGGKDVPKG